MYTPKPMDLSDVKIPEEILLLIEQIAEDIHETWAVGRMAEGWIFGEVRDDLKKTTPCLVPYAELPESEKEYDRRTAVSAIKQVLKFGYTISKND